MTPKPGVPGVICLGASAGGMRSLEAIVSRLTADLPWPVLIAQHLQADRVSQMPGILARLAHMPVREAIDGETPVGGTIYTCPSAHEMGLSMDGTITLRPITPGRPQGIDHLFSTASYARPGRIIAVVLSGTGSDGAAGSLVVKLNNGTVIAESDESAQHSQMPAAAQRAGTVDALLAADTIAAVLDDLARGSLDEATAATRAIVDDIARLIMSPGGTDFEHYRAGTLRRQADKRRAFQGIGTLAEYRDLLRSAPRERFALAKSLLVPVTEFFRDAAAWRALEQNVIPVLARRTRAGHPVRVWCVGCASGEEAYTIAILLAENIVDRSRVHVLATDLDADAVATAARGVFDASRMEGVDLLRRERFFHVEGRGYRVIEDLRSMVQFRVHDVTRDEPPGKFDLIVCRNLLIYFDEALQSRTVFRLRDALAGPQFLYLGRSETLPSKDLRLRPVVRNLRIFRGTDKPGAEERDAEASTPPAQETPPGATSWSGAPDVRIEEPDTIVILVDPSWRILDANDHARRLLDAEIVGTNLLDLFPRWQGSPVHHALRAASETGRSLKVRGAPTPHGPMDVTLERAPTAERATLLIGTPALARGHGTRTDHGALEARQELAVTNEELQTANEELAATNEELQAANAELASLNEEFQGTNQTLASANLELGAVAESEHAAAHLMDEYLQRWREALVACDAARRITLFNRKAADLFGLDASSIGRPVGLAPIGVGPEGDVGDWLERSVAGPIHRRVDHPQGGLVLTIEHVRGPGGEPLGWVLSWSAAAP